MVLCPGILVGSLEILGNPTGLVRSIGNGVADLFSLPYQGLSGGPGGFLAGVRKGSSSLLWHVSTGKTIIRNIDKRCLIRI